MKESVESQSADRFANVYDCRQIGRICQRELDLHTPSRQVGIPVTNDLPKNEYRPTTACVENRELVSKSVFG